MVSVVKFSTSTRLDWRSILPLLAWAGLASMALVFALGAPGLDGQTYYFATLEDPYYGVRPGGVHYAYSPAFLLAVQPLKLLGWQAFHFLLVAGGMAALAYLIGPWLALAAVILQAPIISVDLYWANLYLVTAALLVLAVRHPALWAWPLLTKITPGVGVLYHLGKRDWRGLAIAAGVTAGIAAVSAVFLPNAWADWPKFLLVDSEPGQQGLFIPLSVRLLAAAGLAWYAGHADKAWLIGVAAFLAAPQPENAGAYLIAAWALYRQLGPKVC